MFELLPPEIKVADSRSMNKSGDSIGAVDSPNTGDGSQSARPKSSSSEGMSFFSAATYCHGYEQ